MDVGISAIGTAVPTYSYSQKEIVEFIARTLELTPPEKRRMSAVYQATGIDKRYSVLDDHLKQLGDYSFFPNRVTEGFPSTKQRMEIYKKNAAPLAIRAIKDCLNNITEDQDHSSILASITHIITVSCTGMYAPGLDIEIIQQLDMPTTIHRTAINFMGCYGAFNAIKTAHAICCANAEAKVMVVCLELCSIHFQKPICLDQIISSSVFSDGAAAVLIQAQLHPAHCLKINEFYCDVLPQSDREMTWDISDNGFDIALSSYVPFLIESGISHFMNKFFQTHSFDVKDIDHYAIHPGGIKILQACEKALKLTKEQNNFSYETLREYGNMSSVTILFVLKKIWATLKNSARKKNIFCCAFGPGLTLESMIVSSGNYG